MEHLIITDVRARAVVAPLRRPIRTASGSIEASPLVLLDVFTEQGITGRSYLFGYTPHVLASLLSLADRLGSLMRGQSVVPLARQEQLAREFRLLGMQGLLGMVISGFDMAFWDALGQAARCPVVSLLGGEPRPVRAYDSWGLVDPARDGAALALSVEQGFRGIKIKLGGGSLEHDLTTVREVRRIVGDTVALMVDYNQSLEPGEATRRVQALDPFGLEWVEEPVAAEDLQGHAQVRSSSTTPIQTGENWWFPGRRAGTLCRRLRPHDAGPDEDRRHHGLAQRDGPGARGLDARVQSPVHRSQCPRPGGDADLRLAGVHGLRLDGAGPPQPPGRRLRDRPGTWPGYRMG
ncbi:MAG: enolase C-terminal domain-like protein [Burkholderiaceae bacterium]